MTMTYQTRSLMFSLSIIINTCFTRNDDIDELLFDEEHGYLDLVAVKKFDRLDFIFIAGKDVPPWSPQNIKVQIVLVSIHIKHHLIF